MRRVIEADNQSYVIFTPDEAGAPELHEGPWHFEPTDWQTNDVFSEGYPTAEAAEEAARQWEAEEAVGC